MKDRYISRNALIALLDSYKNLSTWNTNVCDPDTILRVLEVMKNAVGNMQTIGPRQLSSKLLAAKNCAIEIYEKPTREDVPRYAEKERNSEAVGNTLLMGYWRGMRVQAELYADIFNRLKGGGE